MPWNIMMRCLVSPPYERHLFGDKILVHSYDGFLKIYLHEKIADGMAIHMAQISEDGGDSK